MTEYIWRYMRSGLLLMSFLLLGQTLFAQTDSLKVPNDTLNVQTDSLSLGSVPTMERINYRQNPEFLTLSQGTVPLPTQAIPNDTPGSPLHLRLYDVVKEQVPETYHDDEGKLRLHIPVAWRDDIDLPLPKGVEKAGPRPPYDPVVAWQRAAIIPGWGQIYNQDYWKLPIFYLGYGAGLGWIFYNHNLYLEVRSAYWASLTPDFTDDDPRFANRDSEGIRSLREDLRNRRDQGILILAGWHVVQIAEAYVDAHLDGFDVSPDLSLRVHPDFIPTPAFHSFSTPAMGLGLTIRF
jgi:hypothetical protein